MVMCDSNDRLGKWVCAVSHGKKNPSCSENRLCFPLERLSSFTKTCITCCSNTMSPYRSNFIVVLVDGQGCVNPQFPWTLSDVLRPKARIFPFLFFPFISFVSSTDMAMGKGRVRVWMLCVNWRRPHRLRRQ